MKRVEFSARFNKKKKLSDEDKAHLEAQRLINPDMVQEPEIEFEYDNIVLDIYDVGDFLRFDERHTQIMKRATNILYILDIEYEQFKDLYQQLTGFVIYQHENVKK